MATAHTRPADALSHHAALAVHGLPLYAHDESRIDVISGVRREVKRSGLCVHPDAGVETTEVLGARAVTPARAIVRTALTMGRDCAVVAGDAALHRERVTIDDLLVEAARLSLLHASRCVVWSRAVGHCRANRLGR